MNRVVLARYNESLEWIKLIPSDFEVIIYNKGETITSLPVIERASRIIDRPNVGRESETYLYHMLTNTECNDDFTVYAQGDPFEHSPDFIGLLYAWQSWNDLQPLSWQWLEDKMIPPTKLLADYQLGLRGRPRVRPERFSLLTWGPLDFLDPGASGMGTVYRVIQGGLPTGVNIAAHFLNQIQLSELASKAEDHTVGVFSYGAIFGVRNNRVSNLKPEALEAMLQYTVSGVTVYGYILERLWLHLLGEDFLLPKNSPPPL